MTPETPLRPIPDLQQRQASVIDELLDAGDLESLIIAAKARAEERNREAQAQLPPPPSQPDPDWAARKTWLLDGQAIHGEIKEFYFPALAALRADDQVEFSRKRDLLFKAVRTFLGDPPPEAPKPVETVVEPQPTPAG